MVIVVMLLMTVMPAHGQVTGRERPKEWDELVPGARFRDRFLPMEGKKLSGDTWGYDGVRPRLVDNGIEDPQWSYWGGNILKNEDGRYHMLVCGWLEGSPRGHMEWGNSIVFNTVSDQLAGPYKPRNIIGKGHNPEVFRLKDGRYVLYVINGRYVADKLNGKWEYGTFDFDSRDRRIIEGLSNLTFTQREDGSFLMVCRGGGVWISEDGLKPYRQLTDRRIYPDVEGEFEDPVIWRDSVQYHLIVNDWLGRIAFYLRSKDGVNWVVDPGEAYTPGIAVHKDGRIEDWFKFERIKVFQDQYGRAVQANFAVIDTLKHEDKAFDRHSSKNITIPLDPGLLLTLMDSKPITPKTKVIRLKIAAEEGFNPQTDIEISSLRFGASSEVNFGRGSKAIGTEHDGKDLIVTFDGRGNGIQEGEFAPKLLGKRNSGKMLYGYARLPYVNYLEPILSARAPEIEITEQGLAGRIEITNFGQVVSGPASFKVEVIIEGKTVTIGSGEVPALNPYEKRQLQFSAKNIIPEGEEVDLMVILYSGEKVLSTFSIKKKILE